MYAKLLTQWQPLLSLGAHPVSAWSLPPAVELVERLQCQHLEPKARGERHELGRLGVQCVPEL